MIFEMTEKQIVDLFDQTDKRKFAQLLSVLLDDNISSTAVRLEREYNFIDEKGKQIASDCFISTPRVGEFYIVRDITYEVKQVFHVFNSSRNPGTIKVRKLS